MQLFYTPNTISMAVAIALQEADIEHELTLVDFAKGEQLSAGYLDKNPKGRVPTLIVEGQPLTETGALLELIATFAPEKNLVPTNPLQAVKMRSVMFYLASTMHVNHAHRVRGIRWANDQSSIDDMAAKAPETMAISAKYIEEECLTGPFILGDTISIADIYLFNICTWLAGDSVIVSNYPKITAHMALMETRASVQKIRELGILT
ncbi:MAG: glutathione S-transferase [Ascidiaceihabitans sp.]|jgi:glutathione S-transferase